MATAGQEKAAKKTAEDVEALIAALDKFDAALADQPEEDTLKHAFYCADVLIPQMEAIREVADSLEEQVEDALWPLAKYREMLFLS